MVAIFNELAAFQFFGLKLDAFPVCFFDEDGAFSVLLMSLVLFSGFKELGAFSV